jgi:hypothetical protein
VDREHLRRNRPVDVLPGGECRGEARVLGQVGDGPQLHLVVVGHQQTPAGGRDEGLAEATALLGTDGDVVEVGPVGGQAPGACHGLTEGGVDASIRRHFGGEALPVGGAQLLHLAVAEERPDDGVLVTELFEGAGVGREPGLGLPERGEPQLLVQHRAQLGHGVDLERLAGQVLDGGLERVDLLGEGQHPDQGLLDVDAQPVLPRLGQGCQHGRPEPGQYGGQTHRLQRGRIEPRRVPGVSGADPGVVAGRNVQDEGALALGPRAVVDLHGEEAGGQVTNPVAVGGGVEQVGPDRRVQGEPGDVHAQGEQ